MVGPKPALPWGRGLRVNCARFLVLSVNWNVLYCDSEKSFKQFHFNQNTTQFTYPQMMWASTGYTSQAYVGEWNPILVKLLFTMKLIITVWSTKCQVPHSMTLSVCQWPESGPLLLLRVSSSSLYMTSYFFWMHNCLKSASTSSTNMSVGSWVQKAVC